jgi:hypothetical protein
MIFPQNNGRACHIAWQGQFNPILAKSGRGERRNFSPLRPYSPSLACGVFDGTSNLTNDIVDQGLFALGHDADHGLCPRCANNQPPFPA